MLACQSLPLHFPSALAVELPKLLAISNFVDQPALETLLRFDQVLF